MPIGPVVTGNVSCAFVQYSRFGSKKTTGSGDAMALRSSQYASSTVAGVTTWMPGVCATYASDESLWCSTPPMPPPYGIRMTTGIGSAPRVRLRILARWLTSCSKAG